MKTGFENEIVTTGQLAYVFGVKMSSIGNLAAKGFVKRVARGRYAACESVRLYTAHLREVGARWADEKTTAAVAVERAGLLKAQRQRAELDLTKAKGDLVSRAEIMREFDENCRHVQLQVSMLHGYLLNSGVDRKVAKLAVDKVSEGLKIVEDGGSLHEHGGYDRDGQSYYPVRGNSLTEGAACK